MRKIIKKELKSIMQKNDKFHTFLLSHSNKNKIYIRRIEVSKKLLYSSLASLLLIAGIFTTGFSGFIHNNLTAKTEINTQDALINTQQIELTQIQPEHKQINYARPKSADNFAINSGGPLFDYNLTENEPESVEMQMENQLRKIEATTNPANLPTMWAHLGKINNEFGYRRNPFGGRGYEFHAGMDIDGDRGDLVAAPGNGVITKAEWQGGYGNLVEISHGNGLITRYGHLSSINVRGGDTVKRGQIIGLIGSTGRSTGPHLHLEVRLNDKPINPRRFLPPQPSEIKVPKAQ
jgi:murein DD-endopeptidase MepM/ murein hydrolase activator NlpD